MGKKKGQWNPDAAPNRDKFLAMKAAEKAAERRKDEPAKPPA